MHQQHFQTLLAEYFEMRAVFRGGVTFGGDVVDLVLTFLHAADVVVQ